MRKLQELSRSLVTRSALSGKERRLLTTRTLATALLEVFAEHIGRRNAVTMNDLYRTVFRAKYREDSLADYLRWEFLRKALHLLRQQSNCFVISNRREDGEWVFFVVKDKEDAELYEAQINRCISGMQSMQRRAFEAVEKQWWRQSFALPGRRKQEYFPERV